MSSTCNACQKEIVADKDNVTCSGCKQDFHYHCAGFTEKTLRGVKSGSKKHFCQKCLQSANPDGKNLIKPQSTTSVHEAEAEIPNKSLDAKKSVIPTYLEKDSDIVDHDDLKTFIAKKFTEFQTSLEYHIKMVSDLTENIKELKSEVVNMKENQLKIEAENTQLKADLVQVKVELMELQQYTRRTNVEISGLPELEHEDIRSVVSSVFKHIKLDNFASAVTMHRVPTRRHDNHKPIIVQFNNKFERDQCLQKAKQCRFIASDINPRFTTSPVFVNEHLAPATKRLFYLCKTFKNEHGFKYCWIKEGKIFLRQGDNARVYRIQKENDLLNVPHSEH